jgi:hypothetical protein
VRRVQVAGVGRGEDGNQDAEHPRTAELVGHIDQAGGSTDVLPRDVGNAGGGQRAEAGASPAPIRIVGSATPRV